MHATSGAFLATCPGRRVYCPAGRAFVGSSKRTQIFQRTGFLKGICSKFRAQLGPPGGCPCRGFASKRSQRRGHFAPIHIRRAKLTAEFLSSSSQVLSSSSQVLVKFYQVLAKFYQLAFKCLISWKGGGDSPPGDFNYGDPPP